jgi:hypothetical protein
MRHANLFVCLIVCLFLSIHFLLPGRSLRNWRQQAITLLGVASVAFTGLSLYAISHKEVRQYYLFHSAQGLLVGFVLGTAICLLLSHFAKKG